MSGGNTHVYIYIYVGLGFHLLTEFATNITYKSLKCFSKAGRNAWKGILQIIESALKVWEKLSNVLDFITLKKEEEKVR